MRKIALITPMLQPYRLTFYSKLDKFYPNAEWKIFHGVKKTEDGRPAYSGHVDFNHKGLVETKFLIGPFKILLHKNLLKEIKKFNPDLIIIQAITGNISYRQVVNWGSRNNKVIVGWTCAWEPGLAKGMLLEFKNRLVSLFFRKSHAFLTYSTKAIDYVVERGVDKSKISVCYNGIEIDDMVAHEPEVRKEAENIMNSLSLKNHTVFIYVGGLLPEKRMDLLLDAFEGLKKNNQHIKLLIIGDGPLKGEITLRISRMNDSDIIYLGRIIDGVDPYFAASTCLVLPGVGGLALNQAMFWEKLCIASEADGTEEDLVIDCKTGFRFIKDDLSSLTSAMQRVIDLNDDQRLKMGKQAREIILTKSNVNNMVDVFTDTISDFFPELRPKPKDSTTYAEKAVL